MSARRYIVWVTTRRFSELTGYTVDAINSKIKRGDWPQGVMWINAPDGRRLINLERYEEWVTGNLILALGPAAND